MKIIELNVRGTRRRLKKKRVAVRTPGGKIVYHYKPKRHGPARCALCKKPLNATPTSPKSFMKKLPKSKKRPNRPYGGYLCPSCLRKVILRRALEEGEILLKGEVSVS
ncbi:MAG TPA: 50S ribosomal protein L34e [Candidatus Korarchaeota archaeon]|nr:50S ribosomal protein L34e [Candidatus Korarchaeota archaeon]